VCGCSETYFCKADRKQSEHCTDVQIMPYRLGCPQIAASNTLQANVRNIATSICIPIAFRLIVNLQRVLFPDAQESACKLTSPPNHPGNNVNTLEILINLHIVPKKPPSDLRSFRSFQDTVWEVRGKGSVLESQLHRGDLCLELVLYHTVSAYVCS